MTWGGGGRREGGGFHGEREWFRLFALRDELDIWRGEAPSVVFKVLLNFPCLCVCACSVCACMQVLVHE